MRRLIAGTVIALLLVSHALAALPPIRDFAVVTASAGYDNAATTIVLTSGDGAKLPNPGTEGAFWLVWFNATDYGAASSDPNREVVKVTARTTDTLTVVRGQSRTTAVNHNTAGKTYRLTLSFVEPMWTALQAELSAISGSIPNVVDCASSCSGAVSTIGSVNLRTLRASASEVIASNLTITPNMLVWPIGAGQFSISSSVTLTFDRPDQILADGHRQIFTGAGALTGVVFQKSGIVYPKWWGAVCDGATDDAPAITAAIASLPSGGGTVDARGCGGTYRLNAEIASSKNNLTILNDAATTYDLQTIAGTGTTGVHDTATVLAGFKLTGTNQRFLGGRITGVPTVSSKNVIGVLLHGATQPKIGGVKIDGLYAGVWMGGNTVQPTLQTVELASNSRNLLCGYLPTTTSSPQVTDATLLNVTARNATVGDGVQLYSYCEGMRIIGGQFYSNASNGINGYVGGGTLTIQGIRAYSNSLAGAALTYNSLSGTISNKLGEAKKCTILGNRFDGNTGDGLTVKLADYSLFTQGGVEECHIAGNLSENNGGEGYDLNLVRSTVHGNRARGNTLDGFRFGSLKHVSITDNHSFDNGTTGANKTGFNFQYADTTGATPPNSQHVAFSGNHAGDTRSGGNRTVNFSFSLQRLQDAEVENNHGSNANTADWTNVNGLTNVAFWNNRGAVSGSDVIGAAIGKHLRGSKTYDPPSLNDFDIDTETVTVPGAAVGDSAMCVQSTITAAMQVTGIVSSADTVTAVIRNISGGTVDPASGTLACEVWKP